MSKAVTDVLDESVKSGVVVVRSTRLGSGLVLRNSEVDDDKLGFVASGELNPGKSRAQLQLALTRTNDPSAVQRMFDTY
jgi:L-asparaginase